MTKYSLDYPEPIIYEPKQPADSSIIWLHGLGANGDDFKPIVPLINIDELRCRLIFPNAPMRPITVNQKMIMPAWYDIKHPTLRGFDQAGISETNLYIQSLINEQIKKGIASERIILAGFSQGGAIAIYSATHSDQKLAGVLALSCYLLKEPKKNQANQSTPILMLQGTDDPIVSYALAKNSSQTLINLGFSVDFRDYTMGHEISSKEIKDLICWIQNILKGN